MATKKTTGAKAKPTAPRGQRSTRSRRAPTKSPARAKKVANKPAKTKPAEPSRALTIPDLISDNPYLARTRSILERRQRRAARLRADTRRELQAVLVDIRKDAEGRLDKVHRDIEARGQAWFDKARGTKVGAEIERIPDRMLSVTDGWLDRVGLVRKSTLAA